MAEWGFTVATQEIDCPKPTCLAKKGAGCRTPKGRPAATPHGERMALMTKAQWARCTGTGMTGTQFVEHLAQVAGDQPVTIVVLPMTTVAEAALGPQPGEAPRVEL